MTPTNERLLAKIHSIREKIFSAVRELEDLGVDPKDVAPEDFNAAGEAIGLLKDMAQAYRQGDELPELVAAQMEQEILKTELLAQHHVGRMIAHVARARGVSAIGYRGVTGGRSAPWSKPFIYSFPFSYNLQSLSNV